MWHVSSLHKCYVIFSCRSTFACPVGKVFPTYMVSWMSPICPSRYWMHPHGFQYVRHLFLTIFCVHTYSSILFPFILMDIFWCCLLLYVSCAFLVSECWDLGEFLPGGFCFIDDTYMMLKYTHDLAIILVLLLVVSYQTVCAAGCLFSFLLKARTFITPFISIRMPI